MLTVETMIVRLTVSLVFGLLIGFEREWQKKPAGLRTIMLVCLGSTLFTLTGIELVADFSENRGDILRVLGGIATGIGFLGAGTIVRHGAHDGVLGLTTAAAIWMVSAIGVAIGAGYFVLATIAEVLALTVILLKLFEPRH